MSSSLLQKILGVVFSPGKYMAEIVEKPFLEEALLLVGFYATFGAISAYISLNRIIYDFQGTGIDQETMNKFGLISGLVAAIVMSFFIWATVAGGIHLLAQFMGGKGSFRTILVVVGFSLMPVLLATLLETVLIYLSEPVYITMDISNPAAMGDMMDEIYQSSTYMAMAIIGALGWIWAAFIQLKGTVLEERLSQMQAGICVGVPLILMLIMTVGTRYLI